MLLPSHLATPFGKAVTLEQGPEDAFAPSNRTKWVNTAGAECSTRKGDRVVSANAFLSAPSR